MKVIENKKPLVVISGVNLVEAGPLSVFKDAIKCFVENFIDRYSLLLIVHKKELFDDIDLSKVAILEFRYPKKQWLLRVWFEYVHLYFISRRLDVCLWFSMHDMTPNVKAKRKAVYCHNPAPFYKISFRDILFEKSLFFFRYFYSLFYRINIRKNNTVVVQQDWLRKAFKKRYNVENVLVAYPDIDLGVNGHINVENEITRFVYPAMPRIFKNYEVLLNAAEKLSSKNLKFEVVVTIDGTENKYGRYLKETFQHVTNINFIGLQSRNKIFELYRSSDCLVFPSKLETWGLPVTEMKHFGKPILIANAPYATETVGNYDKVRFFEQDNAMQLAELMEGIINNSIQFTPMRKDRPSAPFSNNWKDLFDFILN